MPLKGEVGQYLDKLSPAARIIGTVNTIVNENGRLKGYITDGEGYVKNPQSIGSAVTGKKLPLWGGGAATAIIAQSALDGAREIAVFNMKDTFFPKVEANIRHIASQVPSCKMALYDLADTAALRREIESSDILTNATRVGMAPLEDQSLITDLSLLRPGLVVADTVYHPLETKLLRDAKAAGCKTAQGLGMLLWQVAAAFALYSGEIEEQMCFHMCELFGVEQIICGMMENYSVEYTAQKLRELCHRAGKYGIGVEPMPYSGPLKV